MSQSPMEERRLLLAVALSLLVLTGYRLLVPAQPRAVTPPGQEAAATLTASPPPATVAAAPPAAPAEPSVPVEADERERRIEVQGEDWDFALTNKGARLVSWTLHRFRDAAGRREEMVQGASEGPRPLDVETGDPDVDRRLREGLYRASTELMKVPASGNAELTLRFSDGVVSAEKKIEVRAKDRLVSVSVSVQRAGRELDKRLVWGPGIGNPTPAEMEVRGYIPPEVVALSGRRVERVATASLQESRPLRAVQWVGVDSQ